MRLADERVNSPVALPSVSEAAIHRSDELTILYPYDVVTRRRTGAHPGKTFFADGSDQGFNPCHKYFVPIVRKISGFDSMWNALMKISAEGKGFVVHGKPANPAIAWKGMRRILKDDGRDKAGLLDQATRVLPLDCDGWPNIWKLDPRTEGDDLRAAIVSILGEEFEGLKIAFAWSSSCCVKVSEGQAPDQISFRIWIWASERLNQRDGKDLVQRLDARVRAELAALGGVIKASGYLIDPKVLETVQPVYIASPAFEAGRADPFAGRSRWHLMDGDRDTLDVMALLKALPSKSSLGTIAGKKPRAATIGARPVPVARSPSFSIPGQAIPFAAAGREIASLRATLAATSWHDFRLLCNGFGLRRAALEMVALAQHRGGLHEGERNNLFLQIAACVIATLPLTLTVDQVRGEVRAVGRLCVDESWIRAEWEGTADQNLIDRYLDDVEAETTRKLNRSVEHHNGRRCTYRLKTLAETWDASIEEIQDLKLLSIAKNARMNHIRRKNMGAPDRTDYVMQGLRRAPEVLDLLDAGLSRRAISTQTGIPLASVIRMAKLSTDRLEQIRAWIAAQPGPVTVPEAEAVAEAATTSPSPGGIAFDYKDEIIGDEMAGSSSVQPFRRAA